MEHYIEHYSGTLLWNIILNIIMEHYYGTLY